MASLEHFLDEMLARMLCFEFMRRMSLAETIYTVSDRDHLIDSHQRVLDFIASTPGAFGSSATTCTAPNESFPIVQLVKANMISINDILRAGPDIMHKGKFLLCRSIMPEAKLTPNLVTMVVGDPDGQHCFRVALFNFPETIRPGTVMAIMNPWIKTVNDEKKSAAIRVINPQHIHIFDGSERLVRYLVWKETLPMETRVVIVEVTTEEKTTEDETTENDSAKEGNRFFKDKNYPKALEAYSKEIATQPNNPILYSNRALTYLRMEKPMLALQDTEMGLNLDPANVKLAYRKGKALIELKRYEEAAAFLDNASRQNEEAKKEKAFTDLVTASKRMVSECNGNFDMVNMIKEAKRSNLLENHADYYAKEKFEMKDIPGKGRGLVAKEKIKAGTLLMACRAFVFANSTEGSIRPYFPTTPVTFSPLVQKATKKLLNNPELGDDFYKLNAGKKLGWLEKADQSNPVDIDRISAIVRINSVVAENSLAVMGTLPEYEDAGLWIMPSFINHSCVDCNCFRFIIGDFMFIRACMDIGVGDELLVAYVSPWESFENRRETLKRKFGLECSCRLCQLDRKVPQEVHECLDEIGKVLDESTRRFDRRGCFVPDDVAVFNKLLKTATKNRPET